MCDGGDEGSSGSGASGGATGGIGFSDVSGIGARDQAAGKSAAERAGKEDEGKAAESRSRLGKTLGTLVGFLSPVPGGAVLGGIAGEQIGRSIGGERGAGLGGTGERGAAEGEGGGRPLTSFPSRDTAAETVLKTAQDRRRALRGRKATILTSPRGVTTEAPGRKTLLGA